ncbi:MAG TPA: ACT domain-containing protein [Lacunisphaera sp.]
MPITLLLLPSEFAVCRLSASEPAPAWAGSTVFSAVTRTADELSIICPAPQVPAAIKHDAGWRVLKFQGPFAFSETGILASVLTPLAAAKISILATATFDTDYLLVKSAQLAEARRALVAAGHRVS